MGARKPMSAAEDDPGCPAPPFSINAGWCDRCGKMHTLAVGDAWHECLQLMDQLDRCQRIDFIIPSICADARCTTRTLFTEGGGKMFGVLSCRDANGRKSVLRAFSGQYNGLWQVEGWVDPVFDTTAFNDLTRDTERAIQQLGQHIAACAGEARQQLQQRRRRLSQKLMRDIHWLYRLVNFRGEQAPLTDVFLGQSAPPSGTADCCGPKLLQHAALHNLIPEGMAEFFWGQGTASGTKQHGQLYAACALRCQPILGFMLCGLER